MPIEDFKLYLPKYLSPDNQEKLFNDLSLFPENIDKRFYGFIGKLGDILYQGDGIDGLSYFDFQSTKSKQVFCFVISNTCDLDLQNKRKFPSNVVYAPIVRISKYEAILHEEGKSDDSIRDHLTNVRKQQVTQIFYLPEGDIPESIVFLDRLQHCPNEAIDREKLWPLRNSFLRNLAIRTTE